MDDGFNNSSTGAVLGGGIGGELESWKQSRLSDVSSDVVELRTQVDDLNAQASTHIQPLEGSTDNAVTEISSIAELAVVELQAIGQEKLVAKRFQINFQLTHNIDRQPILNKPIDGFAALGLIATIEGFATGVFLHGSGISSGLGAALGLGLTVSGVSVVMSAGIGGYTFGRYWNYGLKCKKTEPSRTVIRLASRAACVMTAAGISTVLISTGIVRATGETDNISFTAENLIAAATNFHSLMLWGLGASFAVLSWNKGMTAFADPYPGLTEASHAVADCDRDAKLARDEALQEISDIFDEVVDTIADNAADIDDTREELIENLHDVRHQREELLLNITQAETEFEAYRAELISLHQVISGELPKGHDTPALNGEKLRTQIPLIDIDISTFGAGFSDVQRSAQTSLLAARKLAVETISAAFRQTL